MITSRSAPPAKPKPAEALPVAPSGAAPTAPPPSAPPSVAVLDEDGGYTHIYHIEAAETKRLLTRTGRTTREQMEQELPRYVDRIIKRAIDCEVY